jgi:hypothetical protein
VTQSGQNQLAVTETNVMKPIPETLLRNGDGNANGVARKIRAAAPAETTMPTGTLPGFRRLRPAEVVGRGDFVANAERGLEPWEGPGGFRASAFVKPIYRRVTRRLPKTENTK